MKILQLQPKRILTSFFALLAIALVLSPTVFAAPCALSESQYQKNNSYFLENNPAQRQCSISGDASAASLPSGSNVFILGDSITVRSDSFYKDAFGAKNLKVTIDGSSSRSITGKGIDGNKLSGLDAIAADAGDIDKADAIVVALGTNGGNTTDNINKVIAALRAQMKTKPTAPIYWIDTIGVGGANFNAAANKAANQAIYAQSSSQN